MAIISDFEEEEEKQPEAKPSASSSKKARAEVALLRIYLSEPHQVAKSKIPKGHRVKAGRTKSRATNTTTNTNSCCAAPRAVSGTCGGERSVECDR
ncbi:hypothetical protein NL676_023132 [Syzygium grande]|nr:hypothetical protein NL676_023132 [Syzygium grande]